MADNSDVILKVWNALPEAAEPDGWLLAPIVDGWFLEASPNEREVAVAGMVSASAKFGNGSSIRSSALRSIDKRQRFVITQNSVYRLGWPMNASLQADSEYLWPPALSVATSPDWRTAAAAAVSLTGVQTLPDEVLESLRASVHDDGDWAERRAAADTIGRLTLIGGRHHVSEAWQVLAADLQRHRSRMDAAALVTHAAGQAARMYERDLTAEEKLAARGWELIASTDDHQMSKLPSEGVKTDDPIRAAHRLALISEQVSKLPKPEFADPETEQDVGDGVVVLREVGGADPNGAVRAFFRPIAGKRLPLTPVPDAAAVLEQLSGEFPHARQQIALVLADLAGRSSAQLRPTILVGKPGGGKTRLARRLGEAIGLRVIRYDGAAASDSSFGGTARRWSTGEPSVPVAALLSARKSDGLVLIDEIEKAGTGRQNGSFVDSLLGFLEPESAKRYPDPYAQAEVDVSRVSYLATGNDTTLLPTHLRDRFRIVRIPEPRPEDLPALARFIVKDLAAEDGMDERWFPPLDEDELYVAAGLWKGGSVRRLREIVSRILMRRSEMRH